MRGTSGQSLATVRAAVAGATGDLVQVGQELFAAAAAIDAAPALRRVLTDPSTENEAKAGLATTVFGAKVAAPTLAVLTASAAGRWAAGHDLTDSLEIAGVDAIVAGSGGAGASLDTELFEAERVIVTNPELRSVVEDRSLAPEAKSSLLADVFGTKVSAPALALLQQASVARAASFEKTLSAFADQVAQSRGAVIAEVTVAYELDATEQQRLSAAISKRYGGKPVQLNIVVNPDVIGGISVEVSGEVVDATMSTRLEAAKRLLAG